MVCCVVPRRPKVKAKVEVATNLQGQRLLPSPGEKAGARSPFDTRAKSDSRVHYEIGPTSIPALDPFFAEGRNRPLLLKVDVIRVLPGPKLLGLPR